MRRRHIRWIGSAWIGSAAAGLLLASAATPAAAAPAAAAPVTTTLRAVQLATRGYGGGVSAVNPRGQVVGVVADGQGNSDPVLWSRYDTATPVGVPRTNAKAINNRGDVLGEDCLWIAGDTTVLEHPDGKAWAEDVNDRRQITGELEPTEGGLLRGFRWQAGVFTEIVGPPGMSVWPTAINERGDVSGLLQNDAGTERIGFLWRDGVLTELPAPDGGGWVEPTAMNDRGHVVGSFTPAGASVTHPFRWAGGRMTDLLAGRADAGHAYDVNNAGLVVGDAGGRPAAWSSGRTVDIGTPGRTGTARDVDEGGVIVGESASPSDNRVFRLRGGRTVFSAEYPADTRLDVTGVDARGRVAGTVITVDYDATPVVWRD
jgi:probable HAF family extracellular repeat protein